MALMYCACRLVKTKAWRTTLDNSVMTRGKALKEKIRRAVCFCQALRKEPIF
jgi:hypothetical protein